LRYTGRRRYHAAVTGSTGSEPGPLAAVADNGAVLLGRSLACDAHYLRPLRLLSHAHADHLYHLTASLKECQEVLATPLTRDFLAVLKGSRRAHRVRALPYGEVFSWEGERLTLFPAGHIAGSAQALLETREGLRIAYTGDVKSPPAEPLRAELLVIEATYGHPDHVRPFRGEVEEQLVELARSCLKQGPLTILGYHGKLQEAAGILARAGFEEPIVAPDRIFALLEVCRRHGLVLGRFHERDSLDGQAALKERHIALRHLAARGRTEDRSRIILSGWQFDAPVRRLAAGTWQVALSDHCDFEELLEYVRRSGARRVIADSFRCQNAVVFAREVERRLGVQAQAMP
jgi:putative mRNA 3-end processing factor